jgi:hypothetical protein
LNPSLRESVLVLGILHGTDIDSPCVVRAVKVSIPRLDFSDYVKAAIAEAPAHLPAGHYTLTFEGRKMKAERVGEDWRVMGFQSSDVHSPVGNWPISVAN